MVFPKLNYFPIKILLSIAVLFLVVYTAIYSIGYHHADEHYQLIEFANYFLGNSSANDLPWEFNAQIRPSVQPLIAVVFISICNFLGLNNPFDIMTLLRISTGIFGVWVYLQFFKSWRPSIKSKNSSTVFLLFFSLTIWFMPYLLVRFSSENLSSLFFLWALSFVFAKLDTKRWIYIGFLLGLSFAFRFQMALAIIGFIFWMKFIQKIQLNSFYKLFLGATCSVLVLVLCDYWFYNELIFSPWNYFKSNLIDGKAADFGVHSWWFYFAELWELLTPFIAIPILFSFLVLFYCGKRKLWIWIIVPFFLIHNIIGHKEVRFLFPLVFCIPILMIECYDWYVNKKKSKRLLHLFFIPFLILNLLAVSIMASSPAADRRIAIAQKMEKKIKDDTFILIHTHFANPYEPWIGLKKHWYLNTTSARGFILIDDLNQLNNIQLDTNTNYLLMVRGFDFNFIGYGVEGIKFNLELIDSSYSEIQKQIGEQFSILDPNEYYYLFKIEQKKEGLKNPLLIK